MPPLTSYRLIQQCKPTKYARFSVSYIVVNHAAVLRRNCLMGKGIDNALISRGKLVLTILIPKRGLPNEYGSVILRLI